MAGTVPRGVWVRWLRDFRVWAVVALAAHAVAGFLLAPIVLRSQIPAQIRRLTGREAVLRSVRVNPYALSVTLAGFELKDLDGAPLIGFEELYLNLQIRSLFQRAWVLREIRLAAPRLSARILPDGRFSVADLFEPKPDEVDATEPFRVPRIVVERLVVERGGAEFVDESVTPRYDHRFEPLDIEVRGLSTLPDRRGDSALDVGFEGGGRLSWKGDLSMQPLRAAGRVEISGARLPVMWEYLGAGHPLDVARGTAAVALTYEAGEGPQGLTIKIRDGSVDVRDVIVRARGGETDWLKVTGVEVRGAGLDWPEARVSVDSVRIVDPTVEGWLDAEGRLNWAALLPPPVATAAPAAGESPWTAGLARFEISGGAVRIEDRSVTPPVVVAVDGVDLRATGLSTDLTARVPVAIKARIHGSCSASIAGDVRVEPPAADLDLEIAGLDVAIAQAYLGRFTPLRLESAVAGAKGKLLFDAAATPKGRFRGEAGLDRLRIVEPDGSRLVAWERLAVTGVDVAVLPDSARVRSIRIDRPFAKVRIDRDGRLNLSRITHADFSATAAAPPAPTASASAAPPIEVEIVTVKDGVVDFADLSLVLPFATQVHSAGGEVRDLSTRAAVGATVALEGKVEDYGFAKAEGTLRPFDPFASTDLRVLFRNIEMNRLSPYTAEFAGYAIRSGRLDLDVRYRIEKSHLVGEHRLVANQLELGDKVEGRTAAGFAVRLAVALLKDKDGKIDLDVPIEGSVDSPEFAYRAVAWQAVKKILANVATAPFRFLGRALGIDGDQLSQIGFEPGRTDLLPPEREKLVNLADGVRDKPELKVAVGGRFDPETDATAMRVAKLDALIAARRGDPRLATADPAESEIETILVALYVERFAPEIYQALRMRHTVESDAGPIVDEAALFAEVRADLLEAQPVEPQELSDLAAARAAAIVALLSQEAGLAAERVAVSETGPVPKKETGRGQVSAELALSAD